MSHERSPLADAGVWKNNSGASAEPELTGRFLVSFKRGKEAVESGAAALRKGAGISMLEHASDEQSPAINALARGEIDTVLLDRLGIAVVAAQPDQQAAVLTVSENESSILRATPEKMRYASESVEFLQGWQQGANDALERAFQQLKTESGSAREASSEQNWDESTATWGIQATGSHQTPFTGKGLRIAILDTGIDLQHPAFTGRQLHTESFVPDQAVQDGNGHGTHCAGIACGGWVGAPRYGVATEAEICVGKVLGNDGRGPDLQILAGIDWALSQGCQVVSMSLGSPARPGMPYEEEYEDAAQAAAEMGTLLIAAAGNSSRRPGQIMPVQLPASCPSIVAVAAVTPDLDVAPFSCGRGSGSDGVDLAGPGVDVLSSWPQPPRSRKLSGTSMATPYVAGIALLTIQAEGSNAGALRNSLTGQAQRLQKCSPADVGAGLVQAPGG
ncbi:S8 family serine peptidase [Streptomyces sp. NPDC058682]|uniref:S8 family serine peptidase n=1 Tax=Streptomyces sp. NPDC058682 TaxID=3346596 RepID=UPI0036499A0F